jgi:hypothetical protein
LEVENAGMAELKDMAQVSNNRSWRASVGRRQLGGRGEAIRKIRAASETSGIEFIDESGTGRRTISEVASRKRKQL